MKLWFIIIEFYKNPCKTNRLRLLEYDEFIRSLSSISSC